MWPANLPRPPSGLDGVELCIAGSAARRLLGGPRLRLPPELIVAADEAAVRRRRPDAAPAEGRPGELALDGWLVRPAPEGLGPALEARGIPVDAIGVRPDGEVLDPLEGLGPWRAGRLASPPDRAYDDRPHLLLMLPALAAELSLRVEDAAATALAEHAGLVLRADRHALREAMTRLLVGQRVYGVLQLVERTRLMAFVLPEVAALVGFHRTSRHHHKDVWQHTRQVVQQALPRPQLRWAALLHDIGKVHTRSYEPPRKVHFFRHEELGAFMFEGIAARLRFPAALAERVRVLILHHLRANLYDPSWTDAAVRRFAAEMGPWLDDLIHLSRADVTSRRPGRRREAMHTLHALRCRIERLRAEDEARRPVVPRGLGTAIIDELGVPPGPRVGELRRACEEAVREGRLPPDPDIATCIEFLRSRMAA